MRLYAEPLIVDDASRCRFYHVVDVPGEPVVGRNGKEPSFDLRGHED